MRTCIELVFLCVMFIAVVLGLHSGSDFYGGG